MSRLRKFLDLDLAGRLLLVNSFLVLPPVALMLKLYGFRRSRRILASLIPDNLAEWDDRFENRMNRARIAARLVNVAAARGLYKANCLERSLTLWWLLRRQGIDSQIRFGSRKVDGGFEAHAWVELDEAVLNDSEDVRNRFAPLQQQVNSDVIGI